MNALRKFGHELFRRKVVRLLGAYIAVFWLLAQGFASVFPALGVPGWVLKTFIAVGIAAIPVLAWFSWKYDLVPPHLVRTPGEEDQSVNPGRKWAMLRHDNSDAGYILIKWTFGDEATKEQRFFRPVTIGREANNDIEIDDQRVSRHHAVLFAEEGTWRVRDLESANGTFVGHSRVTGIMSLPQSCELRFHANGPTVSVFVSKSAETLVG